MSDKYGDGKNKIAKQIQKSVSKEIKKKRRFDGDGSLEFVSGSSAGGRWERWENEENRTGRP